MPVISRKYQSKLTWFENSEKSKLAEESYKYDYFFFGIKIFSHEYTMTGELKSGKDKQIGFTK